MRFAFISDIHGNLHALDLVLTDLAHTQFDHLICLGDIASLGPQPREVIARLQALNIPVIMGNHENYLLHPELTASHRPWLRATELWCISLLSESDLNYMRAFPSTLRYQLDDKTSLLCYHGSPRSNEEFIYPDRAPESLDETFAAESADLYVGGHTHIQMLRRHKLTTIINPGSVGMPFEFPAPGQNQHILRHAEYGLLDWTDGKLTTDLRRLPIDFEHLAQVARASGIPDVEFWISTWSI